MSSIPLRYPKGYQFFDANGQPLAGAQLYYYRAGTTIAQDTYADYLGATVNSNPVVLDGSGRLTTDIYLSALYGYKEVLSINGVTMFPWPDDNIPGGASGSGIVSANGASRTPTIIEELLTLSGASVASTVNIPAGSILYGVSCRTVTAITGATSYSVGVAGNATQFGSGLSIAAGAANGGLIGPIGVYSNTPVVITPAGGSFTGGQVRISIEVDIITPPQK